MGDRQCRDIRRVLGLLAGIAVVAVAAGCGDGEPADDHAAGEVRPFSEVQADAFVFEPDPTNAERGIFRVTTTEPMICAIVWGETEQLGNLNNSLAMNGTGIVDHDVFLSGAEPGRTYHFQVQGSTADGTLYRSATATFTIPAVETTPPVNTVDRGDNLALGATVVDVSSEFSDGFAALNAIDDSGTSEWSSDGDGDDAFITLDLGEMRDIGGVEFITRSMPDGSAIAKTFRVTIDDGDRLGPFPAATPVAPNVAAVHMSGRIVRFDVETSTGGNVGAVEVRILGA